ncbi:Craniofacial development protein 1 [Merluccius polli]|uniref:Craniofacial development protein 1 n=1 Tax=Merluccius polli TaxID=89951 RepID=A0AA47MB95_MERPO|nr:Craniofacial development protein 1 [Merluccius polli]
MNYSDYDSDGYSSNEDADYLPSADNLSEDDMNECVKEDPLEDDDSVPQASDGAKKKKRTKRKEDNLGMRKRKKGVLKVDEDKEEGKSDDGTVTHETEEEPSEKVVVVAEEVKLKKKADDLWASFLSDVGTRPKQAASPAESSSTEKAEASSPRKPTVSMEPKAPASAKPAEPSMVTITKVFDFAGEEVRVTKEVAADSREAKGFLKTQSSQRDQQPPQLQQSSTPSRLPGPRYDAYAVNTRHLANRSCLRLGEHVASRSPPSKDSMETFILFKRDNRRTGIVGTGKELS